MEIKIFDHEESLGRTLFCRTTDVYLHDRQSLSFWKICFKILLIEKKVMTWIHYTPLIKVFPPN